MQTIKRYATLADAHIDRLKLEAAGIESRVVGVGIELQGGIDGVKLLVPEDLAERARRVLERR